jgi:hypothetical protein
MEKNEEVTEYHRRMTHVERSDTWRQSGFRDASDHGTYDR